MLAKELAEIVAVVIDAIHRADGDRAVNGHPLGVAATVEERLKNGTLPQLHDEARAAVVVPPPWPTTSENLSAYGAGDAANAAHPTDVDSSSHGHDGSCSAFHGRQVEVPP